MEDTKELNSVTARASGRIDYTVGPPKLQAPMPAGATGLLLDRKKTACAQRTQLALNRARIQPHVCMTPHFSSFSSIALDLPQPAP